MIEWKSQENKGSRQVRLWKCQCDCGAITYKATDTLKNKAVSMCKDCAKVYAMTRARAQAGFTEGTQVTNTTLEEAIAARQKGEEQYFDTFLASMKKE